MEQLFKILDKWTIKDLSKNLNVSPGTIIRWTSNNDIPKNYEFDILKLNGNKIDYSKYSSKQKDQFFTPPELANKCWVTFNNLIKGNPTFIEPSAGNGSFMKILPHGSIGFDIEPRCIGIQKQDYLTKKYIIFGNPPFGLRGHLALNFINHSYLFANYVCFILPQLFESDGKGSPRKRVLYNLIYSEKINGVFQIWSKFTNNPKWDLTIKKDESNMKIYSLSNGGTRNKNMLNKCDIYLPSTCFGKENMKLYTSFEDLPGKKRIRGRFF